MTTNHFLLAGDIGGTKTTLAIFSSDAGLQSPLVEHTFRSADFPNLEEIVHAFLKDIDVKVRHACFGVAGPVVQGEATITNLPWVLSDRRLAATFGFVSVNLLNDLVSVANAVPILQPEDLFALNVATPMPGGAIAVVAPGTGLGEAYLTWGGNAYYAYASEGGHTDFAPTDMREMELLRYLQKKFGRVSYERICSGIGLPNIYNFLKDTGFASEPDWLTAEFSTDSDPNPAIVNAALNRADECPLCVETMRLFVTILGAEVGNLALKVLASGGVFLGGGIPPRILPLLQDELFMQAYSDKGRFSALLRQFPVSVILNPKAALIGAARFGMQNR